MKVLQIKCTYFQKMRNYKLYFISTAYDKAFPSTSKQQIQEDVNKIWKENKNKENVEVFILEEIRQLEEKFRRRDARLRTFWENLPTISSSITLPRQETHSASTSSTQNTFTKLHLQNTILHQFRLAK